MFEHKGYKLTWAFISYNGACLVVGRVLFKSNIFKAWLAVHQPPNILFLLIQYIMEVINSIECDKYLMINIETHDTMMQN